MTKLDQIAVEVDNVNAVLPQTQCQECGYQGCKPYAEAIVNDNERIDLCLPGGTQVLQKLGELTGQDPTPYWEGMKNKQKPQQVAVIREDECIGCTKCIQTCPVDAIIGASKQMHTIIQSECTGCELCVEPCPVDCIDIMRTGEANAITQQQADHYRQRYEARQEREAKRRQKERRRYQKAKNAYQEQKQASKDDKKQFIQEALQRVQDKKQS